MDASPSGDRAFVPTGSSPSVSLVPASIPSAEILKIWQVTKGRAWQPKHGVNHPQVRRLIDAGYVEICDMRWGFEAMKDAGLQWTEAGKLAAQALAARGQSND